MSAESYVGDPVALAPREAVLGRFALEVDRRAVKHRLIDAFKGVYADHSIKMPVDAARHHRDDAATRADVELGRARAERVARYRSGILDEHFERALRVRGPHAVVLGAERAAASARWDSLRVRLPRERERDVPAVAFAANQHLWLLRITSFRMPTQSRTAPVVFAAQRDASRETLFRREDVNRTEPSCRARRHLFRQRGARVASQSAPVWHGPVLQSGAG